MIPNNVKVVSTQTVPPYIISYCDDGILYVRITDEEEETVERAKELVKTIGQMVNYKKVPLLAKFDDFVFPAKDNRDFWAKKDSCPYTIAEAFIIDTGGIQLVSSLYMRMEDPERETKMFTNAEEARAWLKTFL